MKASFEDFIKDNPTCVKFVDNKDAKEVFKILTKDANIIKMIQYSEFNKPALAACVSEIEEYIDTCKYPIINLRDDFTRQMIGRMVKTILQKYDYVVDIQKDMPKSVQSKYFSSASCYVKSEVAQNYQLMIIDDVMELKKGNEIYSNLHLRFTISFEDDDSYHTNYVSINNVKYSLNIPYEYRSQGNMHLIFYSECGLWFSLSFDGHKGDMFVNRNRAINYLINVLNGQMQLQEDCEIFDSMTGQKIYNILKNYEEKK